MRTNQIVLLSCLLGLGPLASAQTSPSAKPPSTAHSSATVSSLGDLSTFRAIAVDTLKIVNTGDLGAAKKRIKDLEVSWDRAEPKVKPLAPSKWETVDVAIDRALKEVRAWTATQAASREALQALIATMDATK